MKRFVPFILMISFAMTIHAQGSFVFSGGEAVNFGSLSFSALGSQAFATDRSSSPGYFSAAKGAIFTGVSNTANVDGYVKKYGDEAFTFPVGTGTELHSLAISAPFSAADAFATAWIAGDPGNNNDLTAPNSGAHSRNALGVGIVTISPVGQWDWQDFNNHGAGLTITVTIPDMTAFALTNNLRLVGWSGGIWVDLSGAATASGNTNGSTLSGTMINGISAIGIGSTTWVLGVSHTDFSLVAKDCNAYLTWVTENESGVNYFDIEQSSDGSSFTSIGSVPAMYNGSGGTYHFSKPLLIGSAYYRLKMVDSGGNIKYSAVNRLSANCGIGGNYITLYPNPLAASSEMVRIRLRASYQGKAKILITDNLGQQLIAYPAIISSGENLFTLNTGTMAKGVYYIKIVDTNGNSIGETQKLIRL